MKSLSSIIKSIINYIKIGHLDQAWHQLEISRFVLDREDIDQNINKLIRDINDYLCGQREIKTQDLIEEYNNIFKTI